MALRYVPYLPRSGVEWRVAVVVAPAAAVLALMLAVDIGTTGVCIINVCIGIRDACDAGIGIWQWARALILTDTTHHLHLLVLACMGIDIRCTYVCMYVCMYVPQLVVIPPQHNCSRAGRMLLYELQKFVSFLCFTLSVCVCVCVCEGGWLRPNHAGQRRYWVRCH